MIDFDNCIKILHEALENMTEEDYQKYFPEDTTPKGWISVEDQLSSGVTISDYFEKGYSEYKVKDINEKEFLTPICDPNIWYVFVAKELNITHWFNE